MMVVALSGAIAQAPDFSRWYPYQEASHYAQQAGRVLLVYFWSHGCSYCLQMNTFVFSDPVVSDLLEQKFVVASVDSQSSTGYTLTRQMRAFGTPVLVFLVYQKGEWQELGRLFGSRPRGQFVKELQAMCKAGGNCG
jgi:thioredoxin-related protein